MISPKSLTLRQWILTGLSTVGLASLGRIVWVLIGLNVETYAQDRGWDKLWDFRPSRFPWASIDLFSAGLGWYVALATFALGSVLGLVADGLLRRREASALRVHYTYAQTPASSPTTPPRMLPSKTDSPNYPYRKAVLQMEDPVTSGSNGHSKDLESSDCVFSVRSECMMVLKECTVHLLKLSADGDVETIDEPLKGEAFEIRPNGRKSFRLISRDHRDVVSNPPHLLRLKSREVPLMDNVTYRMEIELRSEYEFPTKVVLLVETDRRFAKAKIESQTV